MGKSIYLSNKLLNHVLRGTAYAAPAGVFMALFLDMTDVEQVGDLSHEVDGGGYERRKATLPAPVNGVITSDTAITFPIATTDWGTVTGWAIMDAPTGGNVLYAGDFPQAKPFYQGDTPQVPAGMTISEE